MASVRVLVGFRPGDASEKNVAPVGRSGYSRNEYSG